MESKPESAGATGLDKKDTGSGTEFRRLLLFVVAASNWYSAEICGGGEKLMQTLKMDSLYSWDSARHFLWGAIKKAIEYSPCFCICFGRPSA